MGGIKKAVNKFADSTVGKVVAPMFTLPAQAISKISGIDPASQLMIGAGVGTAGAAMGAMGGMAGAASVGGGTTGIGGTTAAFGPGGAGVLAQSGGVPLLTKVLLGTSVATTLAGYFGRKSEKDYRSWFDGLNAQDQAAVAELENNLTDLQRNLEVRNQAVQKVIDDYPNVVASVAQARKASGEEFDEVSKQYMDLALSKVAAKYGASGGLSSGAMNEATAKAGAELGLQRLDYMGAREQAAYQQKAAGWQARLAEADALRSFQQKMLGAGVDQRFSAQQAMLGRVNSQTGMLAGIDQSQRQAADQANGQLFGSLGQTLGTAAMLPMYQQLFNPNRAMATGQVTSSQMTGPKLTMPKTAYGGYGA